MAPRKRATVEAELPPEKHADVGEAPSPEVSVAMPAPEPPQPPARVRPAPGLVRLKAKDYFKDGMILGGATGVPAEVKAEQVIEVTPGVYKQLKEASPQNWIVV